VNNISRFSFTARNPQFGRSGHSWRYDINPEISQKSTRLLQSLSGGNCTFGHLVTNFGRQFESFRWRNRC